MNEFKIYSLDDLFIRVKPALNVKLEDFYQSKRNFIKIEDIFECLSKTKWCYDTNLTLADIVDDILSVKLESVEEYLFKKLRKEIN